MGAGAFAADARQGDFGPKRHYIHIQNKYLGVNVLYTFQDQV